MAEPATFIERDNIRYSLQKIRDGFWVFSARRISDDRHLQGQLHFASDPSAYVEEMIAEFNENNPGQNDAPAPTLCYACGMELEADHDTRYQFDNALWVGFHGGYGMFTDACDFPLNTADQWLRDPDDASEYLLVDGDLQDNPDWEPEYEHERLLPGRPDEEAVICHECAHALCDAVPWIAKLIEPRRSHSHHSNHIPELIEQGHQGWDLDRHYAEMEAAYDQQDKENG